MDHQPQSHILLMMMTTTRLIFNFMDVKGSKEKGKEEKQKMVTPPAFERQHVWKMKDLGQKNFPSTVLLKPKVCS